MSLILYVCIVFLMIKNRIMKKTNFKLEEAKQLVKQKISLEEFKKMLNKNGDNFSEGDIQEIRDFLYIMAEIDFIMFKEYMKDKEDEFMLKQDKVKIISLSNDSKTEYLKTA